MKSDKFSLNGRDALKAIAVTIITAFIAAIGQPLEAAISAGDWSNLLPTKLQLIIAVKAAISAGIGYVLRNYFRDSVKDAEKTLDTVAKDQGYSGVIVHPVRKKY